MTIAFRHLPYLVQHKVMDQMDFIDIFSIYSISKNGQTLARSYFNRHKFDLFYFMDQERFEIFKDFQLKDYCFYSNTIAFRVTRDGLKVFNPWSPKEPDFVPLTIPFSDSEDEPIQEMVKFAKELFPKLQLYLILDASDLVDFLDTMKFWRSFDIPLKTVKIGSSATIDDELMKAVLEQCSDVKNLTIYYSSHSLFQYDFRTHAPFKFDFFELNGAEWVTKDHLINLFLGCKKVILGGTHYTDQELTEICEKWLEAPEMQYLEVQSTETFSEGIGKLPGALPVRKLTVPDYWGRKESKIFGSRQCYKVKKADGKPAVVYRDSFFDGIYFRTDFEDAVIGEGV